ncbi:MAG: T9SS type A sorting domain-containing protein, partial [Bacteroidetes bacterium]|nr:T9SS type A sorting domain-containing protein [Bacteroidota bacterium]
IDFGKLWITNDQENLFLRIEVGGEINLQDNNYITLYLDTDNNASTGIPAHGIGAELSYNFGQRLGEIAFGGPALPVYQNDIKLVSSPTVTSTEFEIAISRNTFYNGLPLLGQDSFRICLIDQANPGLDQVPDNAGGISYSFAPNLNDSLPPFSISQTNSQHLRILSYNVLSNNLFEPGLQGNFQRIIQSINPAIIGFQEIYSHTSAEVATKMETFLPSAAGEQWYHSSVMPDIKVVSRYPVIGTYPIPNSGNGAFLIDLGDRDMFFIVAHPPCCANNEARQAEIDAMMGFLRDARNGLIGGLTLENETPIVIVGDMNLVGFKTQKETMLTGDILDESAYGPDFTPDWDGSALEDSKPYTTGLPMTFTWYAENSSFSPGRLDYIVYSGSVMNLENSFALFTPELSGDSLALYNLQADDVVLASDHLPVVADFSFGEATAVEPVGDEQTLAIQVFPNPTRDLVTLNYFLPQNGDVEITIYSVEGNKVLEKHTGNRSAGNHEAQVDLGAFSNGVYLVRLRSRNRQSFCK